MPSGPRVSIGLPVYNGARHLPAALDAILAQRYTSFEVIISDNASDDATAEICRTYAARDRRIRYSRNPANVGAAPNYNRTFALARGDYFHWAAHDDVIHPDFLGRAVEVLDGDPSVVLCHSKVRIIDDDGAPLEDYVYGPHTSSDDAARRFYDLLFVKNHCYEFFGLMRTAVLRETHLHGTYPVGDRVLLAELALRGRFYEIPDYLFYSRDHAGRSVRRLVTQQERAPWFDAKNQGKITFPEWRTLYEYWRAIRRSPLTGRDRLLCELYLLKWVRHYRKRMRHDVAVAASTWLAQRRLSSR